MNKNLTYFSVNNIKINNIDKNRNIIDYLENLNIKIPHYCYHPKLSVSGNCRMCLVELKNSPKPLVSCAMTITNKMEIFTDSPLVKKARENVLEFLLLNHPLDCPICDQGGECDLQDQSMVYGTHKKRFFNFKRGVVNKNLGPIVKTVMTRCIHCTRCVRFSSEIAGVNDLGMFGRGYNSEIGTYVNKFFNSELSGNLIDVCPVGALTNKSYAFVDRSWELTNVCSLDFTTSFGSEVLYSVKSNSVITKIQPFANKFDTTTAWISDKTRFSFDFMFSPERLSNIKITNSKINSFNDTWEYILNEIVNSIYFKNHLYRHNLINNKLTLLVGENINLEVLNVLLLLQLKYSFISIHFNIKSKINKDLESSITTEYTTNHLMLEKSNFCLLIGINTRFENSLMNLKLRNRYYKGNFKIYTISSLLDLTFPSISLGSNSNMLKSITEGNHAICQEIIHAKNPLFIYNSELFKQRTLNKLLENLKNQLNFFNKKFESFNFVNSSLTESTANYLGTLTNNSKNLFLDSSIIYSLNAEFENENLKRFIFLKVLNYTFKKVKQNTYLIQQTNIKTNEKLNLRFKTQILLPNSAFLEESGYYLTTESYVKKSLKVVSQNKIQKNNWEIIRKLFSLLNSSFKFNNSLPLTFSLKNNTLFIKFINLHYFSIQNLKQNSISFNYKKKALSSINLIKNQNNLKMKFYSSNLIFWFNDFYIGNLSGFSKYSKVMIECSKKVRETNTNFKVIL